MRTIPNIECANETLFDFSIHFQSKSAKITKKAAIEKIGDKIMMAR